MLIKDFDIKRIKGAIHVGGHDGGERNWYERSGFNPVIWFEPNVELFHRLVLNLIDLPNHYAYNYGVHDTLEKAVLNVSNNDGQSSSILELGTHKDHHPKVKYVGQREIQLTRIDSFFKKNQLKITDFNFLNIDVQGVELNVIKSFGDSIKYMDYVYTEVNEEHLYKDCCLIQDIDIYLSRFDFVRAFVHWTRHKWGDALYVKKELL